MRLKDKVCIVTGGASGLGKTFSLALAEQGAKVTVCANSSDPKSVVDNFKIPGPPDVYLERSMTRWRELCLEVGLFEPENTKGRSSDSN